jgi:GGDEF domain-containing protein
MNTMLDLTPALVLLVVSAVLAWRLRENGRTIRRLQSANSGLAQREREALSALAVTRQRLENIVAVDPVTGIGNRRAFEAMMNREWLRAARGGTSLGLLLVEVDRFRITAEQLGQAEADECLRLVARCITSGIHRATDLAIRYVDEQFAVVVPDADSFGMCSRDGTPVTISIGAAHCMPGRASGARREGTPEHGIQALLGIAALKLHEARRAGMNCVRGSTDPTVIYNTPPR